MSKKENLAADAPTINNEELDPVTAQDDGAEIHPPSQDSEADVVENASAEGSGSELSELEAQVEQLKQEAEENLQKMLRAQADFENFRRRSRLEKEESAKYASMQLIEQLLPVLDNFDRAISSSKEITDVESLVKGIEMIYRQLDQVLENEGLKTMQVIGEPFDPQFHQAVAQVESDEHGEGIIVNELQKGYILKDKVLRPAMVQVST